jgi:hypothetical protein
MGIPTFQIMPHVVIGPVRLGAARVECRDLEHGLLLMRWEACHAEKFVAFTCKRRGFCPSCGARRMVESAALLADEVLPHLPVLGAFV